MFMLFCRCFYCVLIIVILKITELVVIIDVLGLKVTIMFKNKSNRNQKLLAWSIL